MPLSTIKSWRISLKTLGERLRHLRKSRTLTQAVVADAVGMARPSLSNIERGEDVPGRDTLAALATYYEVSLDWLVTGDGRPDRMSGPAIQTSEGALVGDPEIQGNISEKVLDEQMLFIWQHLSPDIKIAALSVIKALIRAWPRKAS